MKTLLYLPGLGSSWLVNLQRKYVSLRCGTHTELVFFEPEWQSDETYEKKWARLIELTKHIAPEEVHVIGSSAGGPLLTRFIAENQNVDSATCISGKLRGADKIGVKFRKRAPALVDAVKASEKAISSTRGFKQVVVYRPYFDTLIPLNDMVLPGAQHKRFIGFEHLTAIFWALLVHFPKLR